jgi:hypothetical protein
LLLNSTRQTGLAKLDALVIGAYLADPAAYDHETAVRAALVTLAGERAAALLWDVLEAWRAVPDVRTLTADLVAGGRPYLSEVLGRLRPALATITRVTPALEAEIVDRQLWSEITAGIVRLKLLAEALAVLDSELSAAGVTVLAPSMGPGSLLRTKLLADLAEATPEAACDADAVLTLAPAPES